MKKFFIITIFALFFTLTSCGSKSMQERFIPMNNKKNDYMSEDDIYKDDYATIPPKNQEITPENKNNDITPSHLKNIDDMQKIIDDVEQNKTNDVIEINEKLFISQINDIYYNFDDYKDKTIVVEGIYSVFESAISDDTCPVVYRNGPGCCSNDGWAGFLLKYDKKLPKENDWIRVTGTPYLEKTDEGFINLYLNVTNLEVKKERGAENVIQ